MNGYIKSRLSVMMILEFLVWSASCVTVDPWLATRQHFNGEKLGIMAGDPAVGATVSLFCLELIAGEYFAAEKVLAILHVDGGLFLHPKQTSSRALTYGE